MSLRNLMKRWKMPKNSSAYLSKKRAGWTQMNSIKITNIPFKIFRKQIGTTRNEQQQGDCLWGRHLHRRGDVRQWNQGRGVPAGSPGSPADGQPRPAAAGDDLLCGGLRDRGGGQPLGLLGHHPHKEPPLRHELLPRLPRCGRPHHHPAG